MVQKPSYSALPSIFLFPSLSIFLSLSPSFSLSLPLTSFLFLSLSPYPYICLPLSLSPSSSYHGAQYIVRNVSLDVAERASGGVGENDWGAGDGQHVPSGPSRRVGQVHHQPQAVHLSNQLLKAEKGRKMNWEGGRKKAKEWVNITVLV